MGLYLVTAVQRQKKVYICGGWGELGGGERGVPKRISIEVYSYMCLFNE